MGQKESAMRWFRKQDYKSNLIAIFRDKYIGIDGVTTGAGKTSLLTALQAIFYYFNNKKEYKFRKQKFKWYKLTGQACGNQEVPEHAMYSNYGNKLKIGKKFVEPHDVDYGEIRMPNKEDKPFQYFLHGSVIAISEDIELANDNLSEQKIDKTKLEFLKKKRHGHITLLAETQFLRRVAKWERERMDCLIYVWREREDKHFFNKRIKTTWNVWIYTGNEEVLNCGFKHEPPLSPTEWKQYAKGTKFGGREYIQERQITFYGDINKYYDPVEHETEFTKGCKKFTFREKFDTVVKEQVKTKEPNKKVKKTGSVYCVKLN